jgi:hypothetical protein
MPPSKVNIWVSAKKDLRAWNTHQEDHKQALILAGAKLHAVEQYAGWYRIDQIVGEYTKTFEPYEPFFEKLWVKMEETQLGVPQFPAPIQGGTVTDQQALAAMRTLAAWLKERV